MDTKFWIQLENDRNLRSRFEDAVAQTSETEVLFCFGNLIDLVKRSEQDELAEIIAKNVDSYIPPLPSSGTRYPVTQDPVDMIPDAEISGSVREMTRLNDETETLQTIFRISDWTPEQDAPKGMDTFRDISQDFEFKYLMYLAFKDYVEQTESGPVLHQNKVDTLEFVKKMTYVYRIYMMAPDENVDLNDFADMSICATAIIAECSHVLIEEKWDNLELIDKVTNQLTEEDEINTHTTFEEFLEEL